MQGLPHEKKSPKETLGTSPCSEFVCRNTMSQTLEQTLEVKLSVMPLRPRTEIILAW